MKITKRKFAKIIREEVARALRIPLVEVSPSPAAPAAPAGDEERIVTITSDHWSDREFFYVEYQGQKVKIPVAGDLSIVQHMVKLDEDLLATVGSLSPQPSHVNESDDDEFTDWCLEKYGPRTVSTSVPKSHPAYGSSRITSAGPVPLPLSWWTEYMVETLSHLRNMEVDDGDIWKSPQKS